MYVERLAAHADQVIGLEYDFGRVSQVRREVRRPDGGVNASLLVCADGEQLPFPAASFDLVLSHEVLEHVRDDRQVVEEMVRVLRPGGCLVLFVPNRGYPFETHGIYWHGNYRFGNIPLVNYLPRRYRNKLAPHVRVYSRGDLDKLFAGLSLTPVKRTIIYGAYDNLIARFGVLGRMLRDGLHYFERTPLKILGLSHFWVMERQ